MGYSVIYVDYNFSDSKYKNRPVDGIAHYTYGFGSLYARKFKKEFPEWDVQCWKADSYAEEVSSMEHEVVKHIIFPAKKLGRLGFVSRSMMKHVRRFTKDQPKTVFNVSSFDHLLHYQISRVGKSCPVFVQHHGESPAKHKINHTSGLKSLYWRFWSIIEKRAFENTSMLYLLDEEAAKYLPIAQDQFKVRTTGVDSELFKAIDKQAARKLLNLNPEASYLLFIGRLNASKRADMLISVFLKLKDEFPNLGLLIGGCSENDPLYKMAKDSGAVLTGMIPQNEVGIWLSAADVYSLPLLDTAHVFGGIGMLPVQAMFCNTPVVGSTMKCFPEAGLESVGIFTSTEGELKQAIREILSGQITFTETRETALKQYAWSSISAQTESDYLRAIDSVCR
ncbi:MAG: glycosyltransferase family 4 protein [Bacteroidia bacterium]